MRYKGKLNNSHTSWIINANLIMPSFSKMMGFSKCNIPQVYRDKEKTLKDRASHNIWVKTWSLHSCRIDVFARKSVIWGEVCHCDSIIAGTSLLRESCSYIAILIQKKWSFSAIWRLINFGTVTVWETIWGQVRLIFLYLHWVFTQHC